MFEATFQLPPKYQSERVVRLITYPLAHYRTDGTAYLVASAGEYDKYFNDPARFSQQINEYNEIFKGTELVETFAPDRRVSCRSDHSNPESGEIKAGSSLPQLLFSSSRYISMCL